MIVSALVVASLLGQTPAAPVAAEPAAAPVSQTAAAPAAPAPVAQTVAAPVKFMAKNTIWGAIDMQTETRLDSPAGQTDYTNASIKRARLGARGDVTSFLGYSLNYEIGPNANGLKDAYAALKVIPGAEIRAGQFKTPFGYEIWESDFKLLWVNNSDVAAKLGRGPTSRDVGVGLFGKNAIAGPVAFEYALAGVQGAGENKGDDLTEKNAFGRAGFVVDVMPGMVAKLGASYAYGHQVGSLGADAKFGPQKTSTGTVNDDTYFYFHTWGTDLQLDSKYVVAVAEYMQSSRDNVAYANSAGTTFTPWGARSTTDLKGWYVAAYGKTPWSFGPVLRYDQYDPNTDKKDDELKRVTLGAYYDVAAINGRFIVNYEIDQSAKPVARPDLLTLYAQVMF